MLDYKIRFVDKADVVQDLHENIEFELPSAISLMHIVLEYLMKRVEKLGVCKPEQSNLFVALDEAFVNAVKHGNKFDAGKARPHHCRSFKTAKRNLRSRTKAKVLTSTTFPTRSIPKIFSKPQAAAYCLSTTSWTRSNTTTAEIG